LHWGIAACLASGPAVAADPFAGFTDFAALDVAAAAQPLLAVNTASTAPAAPASPAVGPGGNGLAGAGELAEFLVNLARYASWPVDPQRKELTICYAHGGALPANVMTLDDGTAIKGLPVALRPITVPANVTTCNVVWINADVRPAPRAWIAGAADRPVLTVSNYAEFTADGGIVGAYRLNGDWRFEINLEALQRSRINIAAAALRLSQKPKAPRASGESK